MRRFLAWLAILFLTGISVHAALLLPTVAGTVWDYQSTEFTTGEAGPKRSAVVVRSEKELFEGKELLKLETFSENVSKKTELIDVDDSRVICLARAGDDGKMIKLAHPETIVPVPLKVGTKWDQEGEVSGIKIRQRWEVVGLETVVVPAGQFQAYHFHCENSDLISVKLDRWFVPGTGVVKEITVLKGPGLLHRVILELQTMALGSTKTTPEPPSPTPKIEVPASPVPQAPPSVSPSASLPGGLTSQPNEIKTATPSKLLMVEVSSDPAGGLKTDYKSNVANIYVRWHGFGLPGNARVRVAWVAEDVGDLVEPNFVVDETETIAGSSDASARFTLSRPPDGWAEGKYRVEFYVNDELTETVRVRIEK